VPCEGMPAALQIDERVALGYTLCKSDCTIQVALAESGVEKGSFWLEAPVTSRASVL